MTTLLLEVVLAVGPSNAQAERFFSRVTWLSSGRRASSSARLLAMLVTVQELGDPLEEMPDAFWDEVVGNA